MACFSDSTRMPSSLLKTHSPGAKVTPPKPTTTSSSPSAALRLLRGLVPSALMDADRQAGQGDGVANDAVQHEVGPAVVDTETGDEVTDQGRVRGVALRVSQECVCPCSTSSCPTTWRRSSALVDNAVDAVAGGHRDDGDWVEVLVTADDSAVTVTVTDSGPGIDAEVAGDLFERGVSTKPAVPGGRGIGLSLVRLVCTRRGGSVEVRTDGLTVFQARLPLRVEVAAP